MNDLKKYFENNKKNLIHKWDHYFEIYDSHFSRFRGKEINLLEIGVSQGGSLQMWREYFGEKANIYGIDVDLRCKQFEEGKTKIFIGSQEDKSFLKEIKKILPKVDILIDDGGHTMNQQIVTFEELFSHVKDDGVYLCEDLHTSYRSEFGGGYKKKSTFIEYSKNFIDYLNAWHSRNKKKLDVNDFTRMAKSLHFYDSIVVIEKCKMEKPFHSKTGNLIFEPNSYNKKDWYRWLIDKIKYFIKKLILDK